MEIGIMARIELGDEVQDLITGIKGIATGRTTWLTGCDHIQIQPQGSNKDGGRMESIACDEPMVKVVKAGKVKAVVAETPRDRGGPAAPAMRAYGIAR
jgi:hypothetical protein